MTILYYCNCTASSRDKLIPSKQPSSQPNSPIKKKKSQPNSTIDLAKVIIKNFKKNSTSQNIPSTNKN